MKTTLDGQLEAWSWISASMPSFKAAPRRQRARCQVGVAQILPVQEDALKGTLNDFFKVLFSLVALNTRLG